MLMPKKNRVAIYEYLFKEGVMVAKKDFHEPKHPDLADLNIPTLHVIKALQVGVVPMLASLRIWLALFATVWRLISLLQSLKSRGFVNEQFAWRHYYWYLTNEGIRYLRDYLHLPPEVRTLFYRFLNSFYWVFLMCHVCQSSVVSMIWCLTQCCLIYDYTNGSNLWIYDSKTQVDEIRPCSFLWLWRTWHLRSLSPVFITFGFNIFLPPPSIMHLQALINSTGKPLIIKTDPIYDTTDSNPWVWGLS